MSKRKPRLADIDGSLRREKDACFMRRVYPDEFSAVLRGELDPRELVRIAEERDRPVPRREEREEGVR